MNFLKSISATFTGLSIPYNILEETPIPQSIWKVNKGTRKSDGLPVTIFQFDKVNNSNSGGDLRYVTNAVANFKSLKLPYVVQVHDVIEDDSVAYVVTEQVITIGEYLRENQVNEEVKILLLFQIIQGLKYLNAQANSVLGQVWLNNLYLSNDGLFKIGGFEIITNKSNSNDSLLRSNDPRFKGNQVIIPPELTSNGRLDKLDSFKLGVFIYKLFNLGHEDFSISELNSGSNIPKFLLPDYKRLITPSLTVRSSIEQLWSKLEPQFEQFEIIRIFKGFEEYQYIDNLEQKYNTLLQTASQFERFPLGYYTGKILLELVKYYNANSNNFDILSIILSSSAKIQDDSVFQNAIKPIIFKAFTIPDRTIRLLLLTNLPNFMPNLTKSDLNDKIFPYYITGFQDSNAKIREESLKQITTILPLLQPRQLNNDILRALAKLQTDDQAEIRTLTTILLGKISTDLDQSTRANVLAIAFGKSLKDTDITNKIAGLLAISSCLDLFTPEIISNKILTVIAPSLLDKSYKIRTEANKVFNLFLNKVHEAAKELEKDQDYKPDDDDLSDLKKIETQLREEFDSLTIKLQPITPSQTTTPTNSSSHLPLKSNVAHVKGGFHLDHKVESTDSLVQFISKKNITLEPSWNDNDDDDDILDDDGWGQDDDDDHDNEIVQDAWSQPTPAPAPVKKTTVPKPTVVKPKVTRLSTEDHFDKPRSRPRVAGVGGLKLQPKKTAIKKKVLSLDPKDDDEDGWGDDGW